MARRLILNLLLLCLSLAGGAQSHYLPVPAPDDSVTISLLTCAPGSEVYELEGHSALRMQYGATDLVANWGVFDFDSPNFIYRFCKGETDYSIGICPADLFFRQYARYHRRITEQVLDLTCDQALRVLSFVDTNLLPQNRIYRYNYVLDNCATRPLAIVEQALGDSVTFHCSATPFGSVPTFRSEMRYFHSHYPWYQFGIDLALGTGIDRAITQRETMFAPVVLERLVASATISTPEGNRPLVRATGIAVDGPADGTILPPTPWYLTPVAVCWLIFAVTLIVTVVGLRRSRLYKGFDTLLFSIAGIMGCIIAFLVFISIHESTSPNWVLAWLNPLALLVPLLIFFRKGRRCLRWYFCLNILLCCSALIVAIGGIQAFNAAFYPIILAGLLRSANFLLLSRNAKI